MYIGIDLGTTNIKAAIYDGDMRLLDRRSAPVEYIRDGGLVEFDAEKYCDALFSLVAQMVREGNWNGVRQIAFTGQAESLVCVKADGRPAMNAISWMDERSVEECEELAARFSPEVCERVTGQQAVLPTWPATKILWLRRRRPEVFASTGTFMLLKDYIVFRLTGKKLADMSIATFSFYFDIYEKHYWKDMLEAVGIDEARLPALAEPCTVAGNLLPEAAGALGLTCDTMVNIGTLDHFAGMIGTGNVAPGGVTLSTGTVMALAAMSSEPAPRNSGIAMHYGFIPDTHVMLPVAESGGVSLEWFHRNCMGGISYDEMNRVLLERGGNPLLFLPYLVGTNAPEFDQDAVGAFWGLRQEYDVYDMARSVMEGVAFMLRKNVESICGKGTKVERIIATGGGAKSPVWCQLQADITGLEVVIPREKEAACLGAAMAAAVGDGRFADYVRAAEACVAMERCYAPAPDAGTERKYRQFCALYEAALEVARMK